MKKVFAGLLAATMIMSMSVTAFADEVTGDAEGGETTTIETTTISDYKSAVIDNTKPINFEFKKVYETSDDTTLNVYPAETLKFDVKVTTGKTNPGTEMLTIVDQTVASNPDNILVTVPTYDKVGVYYYTVSEVAGNTQGVTYSTNKFDVQVLVTWNVDHSAKQRQISFTSSEEGKKVDQIVNKYDLGSLTVDKVVTGNLGNQEMQFEVDVVFTAEKDIKSDISYVDVKGEHTITATDMADGTESVTITVVHGSANNCTFTNIPVGVTYTVTEHDYVTQKDASVAKENDEYGYDKPTYSVDYATATETAVNDKILADTADETVNDAVVITNNKETNVNTGISLDNMPYIMVLAMVALGLVGFVSKKRSMEF